MQVPVKSSNGIFLMPMETRLLGERKIFLEGEINEAKACDFVKQILFLSREGEEPIQLLINSPGGDMNAGLLMYDVVQSGRVPVETICLGRAYSMAAVLFASGTGGRYMMPHSELMLHEPLLGTRVGGNSSSIRSISDSLIKAKKKMNEILARHTGKTEKEIEKATGYDHYFSVQESIAFGLCDGEAGMDRIQGVI